MKSSMIRETVPFKILSEIIEDYCATDVKLAEMLLNVNLGGLEAFHVKDLSTLEEYWTTLRSESSYDCPDEVGRELHSAIMRMAASFRLQCALNEIHWPELIRTLTDIVGIKDRALEDDSGVYSKQELVLVYDEVFERQTASTDVAEWLLVGHDWYVFLVMVSLAPKFNVIMRVQDNKGQ